MEAKASRCSCRFALPKSTDAPSRSLGSTSSRRVRTRPDGSTTQQFSAPAFDDERRRRLVFSDFLNLFFFNRQEGLGGVIKALEQKGMFQSLAEPNLIAYNGQEASFLAGGEFPVPVVQGTTGSGDGRVQGVRRPPHVHADDRRRHDSAEGEAGSQHTRFCERRHAGRLPDPRADDAARTDGCGTARRSVIRHCGSSGQLRRRTTRRESRLLSKLPIIGYLFRSKAERSEQTELMVLITPRLVRPLNPDEVPPLPTRFKSFVPEGGVGKGMDGPDWLMRRLRRTATAPSGTARQRPEVSSSGRTSKQG